MCLDFFYASKKSRQKQNFCGLNFYQLGSISSPSTKHLKHACVYHLLYFYGEIGQDIPSRLSKEIHTLL